ncbi:MAG TPA: DNA/RNA helicase domain-containing protein, partial [Afifellaceae bacterium]|nr:DNA/RNA helicase domain-containing protein [Afifellaceae bacterium]
YGYRIEDIDVIVIGHFATPRAFDVEYRFYSNDGEPFIPRRAAIKNFILVIEAKSHDATGVKFDDKIALVRYGRGGRAVWEPVTEKNRQQMFEFKRYLAEHGASRVYIQDLIFFSGLREIDFPKRPHNCFGVDASFEQILNILGQVSAPQSHQRDVLINFGGDDVFDTILSPEFPLLQTLEPTPLDRRRMDRIVKAALPENWLDDLGRRQIVIRGRGGVGKTVILLQMAYRAFDREQLRSLVLTYNKALVADMRRTMALLGVPRSVEKGGISVDTVHAFIGRLMHGLGITENHDRFFEAYEERKDALLKYICAGAVSQSDITELIARKPTDFFWDVVFVDEGQDWPANEIEILRTVYTPERIAVADGVDQFVRSSVADWSAGISRDQVRPRRLTRCLRMKANLARFVADYAEALGLQEWDLEPNPDANGGRVLVIEGDLACQAGIYNQLRAEAAKLGNYPVDLLACVPPSLVSHETGNISSVPGRTLTAAGEKVWDATSMDVREHFPTDRDALRIVQYDSCRGLEGWTVINYAFDELWDYKYRQWLASPHGSHGLFDTPEERAGAFASRWVMIPLTRAMDTLVINISPELSLVRTALEEVYGARSDFMEWIAL